MLRFEQIGEDTPKNIMVVTDDANAEMAAISEKIGRASCRERV